jgi:fumarate reductase flavoprotein subunit
MSDFDCVVIGGGLAGMTAARRLQQLGARPCVIERGTIEGGLCNARISGGLVHLAWEAPDEDSSLLLRRLLEVNPDIDPSLASALAVNAGRSIEWLHAEGVETYAKSAVRYQKYTLYPPRLGTGRRIEPDLGPDRLMLALYRGFRAGTGEIRLGASAEQLTPQPDVTPASWLVRYRADGMLHEVAARHVIIADGGFQASQDLLSTYVGANAHRSLLRAMPSSRGDGLKMLLDNGATTTGMDKVYGHMLAASAVDDDDLWPYPAMDKLCLEGALIDKDAVLLDHSAQTGVELVTLLCATADPTAYTIVFDDVVWNNAGRDNPYNSPVPNPALVERGARMYVAETLDNLADQLSGDAESLRIAVEKHNQAPGKPGIRTAPFYAIPVIPGLTFTMGGIRIDASAAVLNTADLPIPGLYAAGSCVGGIHGGPHGGYVGGLATAIELGIIAAESIAGGQ